MSKIVCTAIFLAVALPAHAATKADAAAVAPAQSKDIAKAVAALEKGKWEKARKRLVKLIAKTPGDTAANKLLRQIDTEPKALLGASSTVYLVRQGDSYQSIAQRYLGDPLLFYALARYNGVSVPSKITVGTTLRIPSGARAASETKSASSKADEAKLRRAAKPAKTKPSPPGTQAQAARPRNDSPALAGALRRQGLSALAKGNPRGAVILLERAATADPANKVVAADLARARRIRDAVR